MSTTDPKRALSASDLLGILLILREIQEIAEWMPTGGIGSEGATMEELSQASEEGHPYDNDMDYDVVQRIWRLAESAINLMPNAGISDGANVE